MIERVKATLIDNVVQRYLANHYFKREDKADKNKVLICYDICKYVCINRIKTMKQNSLSVMPNVQTNHHLKVDYQTVD